MKLARGLLRGSRKKREHWPSAESVSSKRQEWQYYGNTFFVRIKLDCFVQHSHCLDYMNMLHKPSSLNIRDRHIDEEFLMMLSKLVSLDEDMNAREIDSLRYRDDCLTESMEFRPRPSSSSPFDTSGSSYRLSDESRFRCAALHNVSAPATPWSSFRIAPRPEARSRAVCSR